MAIILKEAIAWAWELLTDVFEFLSELVHVFGGDIEDGTEQDTEATSFEDMGSRRTNTIWLQKDNFQKWVIVVPSDLVLKFTSIYVRKMKKNKRPEENGSIKTIPW